MSDFWKQNEIELQKCKIIDDTAAPNNWETRSTVARNCCAQNFTDHWLVLTRMRLPEKKKMASQKKQCYLERMEAQNRKWWIWFWKSDCGKVGSCGRCAGRGQHLNHTQSSKSRLRFGWKTTGHSWGWEKSAWKRWRRTKDVQKELGETKEKTQSQKSHSIIAEKLKWERGMFNTLLRKWKENNVWQAKVERGAPEVF